ncbi:MAG: hypothetical protein M3437_10895 [Chloroflexota bacterium]|nr:hypothetical protein [Chloroflexota bacterium]MDQ5866685.1 hypothetical protein [Chloroflexota bacterium]
MKDTMQIRLKLHTEPDSRHSYLVAEVLVNGEPLTDFSYFATDLHELLASTRNDGEFYIVTCWCRDPMCAGLRRGIEVRREPKVVYWHVSEPKPERRFVFERDAYDEAIHRIGKDYKHWLSKRRFVAPDEDLIHIVPDSNSQFFDMAISE